MKQDDKQLVSFSPQYSETKHAVKNLIAAIKINLKIHIDKQKKKYTAISFQWKIERTNKSRQIRKLLKMGLKGIF